MTTVIRTFMHNPPHPGLVVREYLGDVAVSAAAAHLRTTRVTLSRLLNGKAGISANMALRLAAAFGTSPEFWMNMQSQYDLWRASREKRPVVRRFPRVPVALNSRLGPHAGTHTRTSQSESKIVSF